MKIRSLPLSLGSNQLNLTRRKLGLIEAMLCALCICMSGASFAHDGIELSCGFFGVTTKDLGRTPFFETSDISEAFGSVIFRGNDHKNPSFPSFISASGIYQGGTITLEFTNSKTHQKVSSRPELRDDQLEYSYTSESGEKFQWSISCHVDPIGPDFGF